MKNIFNTNNNYYQITVYLVIMCLSYMHELLGILSFPILKSAMPTFTLATPPPHGPRLEDPYSGPLSELAKWQRRQTLLTSLVEQLRSKECRTVVAALVAAKSKLLKRWRSIDMQ